MPQHQQCKSSSCSGRSLVPKHISICMEAKKKISYGLQTISLYITLCDTVPIQTDGEGSKWVYSTELPFPRAVCNFPLTFQAAKNSSVSDATDRSSSTSCCCEEQLVKPITDYPLERVASDSSCACFSLAARHSWVSLWEMMKSISQRFSLQDPGNVPNLLCS